MIRAGLVVGLLLAVEQAAAQSLRPHVWPEGPNLLGDPGLATAAEWRFGGDGGFDAGVSRSADGSGSLRLQSPYGDEDATVFASASIPVVPGTRYVLSVYMRSSVWPAHLSLQIGNHDAAGAFLGNARGVRWGNARAGIWEEAALPYVPAPGVAQVRLKILRTVGPVDGGQIWIDDLYFGEGVGLREAPTPKRAFDGTAVRVDDLGNFEISREGTWIPFFPLCVFSDQERPLDFYSEQGWNCNMWASGAATVEAGRSAVSAFNPHGMMSALALSPYLLRQGWAHGLTEQFESRLGEILDRGLSSHLLLYYWDNENDHAAWQIPHAVIDGSIRRIDGDGRHARRRPVYILQGQYGVARIHANAGLSDVVGTYLGDGGRDRGAAGTGNGGLFILDRAPGQPNPASFAQLNGVRGPGEMRRRIYNAIIEGARAIGYWRDCYSLGCRERSGDKALPIEQNPWWPDMPSLRREIDALMPLIRAPHWTDWTLGGTSSGAVSWGIRENAGVAHVILVNNDDRAAASVTLDVRDVPYRVKALVDHFSGAEVAIVRDERVTIQIPASDVGQGTNVLRLQPSTDR